MTLTRRWTNEGETLFTINKTQVTRCFSVTELRRVGTPAASVRIETGSKVYRFRSLEEAVQKAIEWQARIDGLNADGSRK